MASTYEDRTEKNRRRKALADALSGLGAQALQGSSAGGIYRAPSGMSTLAAAIGSIGGGYLAGKAMREDSAIRSDQRKSVAKALEAMSGSGFPSAEAVPPAAAPAPAAAAPAPDNLVMARPPQRQPPTGQALASLQGMGSFPPADAPPPQPNTNSALGPNPDFDPRRAAALAFLQDLPLEQQQAVVGKQAVSQLFPEPGEGFSLSPGERRYDARGRVIASADPKPEATPAEIQGYELAKTQGYKGTFLDYQLEQKRAGAARTNVNLPEQKYPNAFNEALGKADVETLSGYQKAAEGSAKLVATLQQLEKLNPTAMAGGGAQTRADISNWLSGWTGVQISDPKALADTQQYNAIVTKSILDSLGGSLGAGVSNADVAFIRDTVPKLEYSREARQQLIDYMKQRAADNIDVYNRAREYGEKNQGLRGFNAFPVDNGSQGARVPGLQRAPDGTLNYVRRPAQK